ncbi:MAG: hypothetical protein WBB69_01875 [Anaerolineales bacterium]
MKSTFKNGTRLSAGVLVISLLACRPVVTVGWGEILVLAGVLLFILAPLVLRVVRLFKKDQGDEKKPRGD